MAANPPVEIGVGPDQQVHMILFACQFIMLINSISTLLDVYQFVSFENH